MSLLDLVVRARRVLRAGGEQECAIGVRDGRMVAISPYEAVLDAATELRLADDEVLLPGLVDSHVHVNDPGRTDWEGFTSATRAAAAGADVVLVGEALVRDQEPRRAVADMISAGTLARSEA